MIDSHVLMKQLEKTLVMINTQIISIERDARTLGVLPYELRDNRGRLILPDVLVSKANVLTAIVNLRAQMRKERDA